MGDISSPSLTMALLVGLTAGVSSCMALVGGLVLGVSAQWSQQNITVSRWNKFEPHVYF